MAVLSNIEQASPNVLFPHTNLLRNAGVTYIYFLESISYILRSTFFYKKFLIKQPYNW